MKTTLTLALSLREEREARRVRGLEIAEGGNLAEFLWRAER